jgi:LacI family transcriptional regulator
MENAPRPSLRQIAKVAGVSHVTVSRALRNDPSIPQETAQRLRRLAKRLGYRPNPLVSALLSHVRTLKPPGDHGVIAYLNTWWPKRTWETCYTKTGQFRGAELRAAELGFRLENFWLNEPEMKPARLAQILRARGIRGLLVGPVQYPDKAIDFDWNNFALATIGYSLHSPMISRTCHAHFRSMYRAMEELVANGYRRIGYVTSEDTESRVNSLWGAAYRYVQYRLPARNRIAPLTFRGEAKREELERWLSANRPDAIVNVLQGVLDLLGELGLNTPKDLGFVHLDLSPELRKSGVTGIDQSSDIVGAGAVDLVANQLYTNSVGPQKHPVTQLLEGVWHGGRTMAKLDSVARPRPKSG